jgi:hypothetical protein
MMWMLLVLLAPTPTLDAAIGQYTDGEIEAACAAFDKLRLTTQQSDPAYRRLLRYVGVCRFMEGDRPGAGAAFNALLDLEPVAILSINDFPPDVVDYFERTRQRHAFRQSQKTPVQPVSRRIVASAYTPFGAHQFERGDDGLGQFLLVGQAAGLAAGIGGLIAFESMKEDGQFLDHGRFRDPDAARLLHGVYLAGFVTFAALWVYGTYDGLRYGPTVAPMTGGAMVGGQGRW